MFAPIQSYSKSETLTQQVSTLALRFIYAKNIVEPKKQYGLLGAVVMKSLDLIIDPRGLQIYPNPRSDLPMTEIE